MKIQMLQQDLLDRGKVSTKEVAKYLFLGLGQNIL